jgi:DNA-binding NarL/FixJ family response regulator
VGTRVMLVDDHALVRAGVRALLERHPGWIIVAEACDGEDALRLAGEIPADLVLMDIGMPRCDGIAATALLRETSPAIKIVMLTRQHGRPYVQRALDAGATGYCVKDATCEELSAGLFQVMGGERWLSASAAASLHAEHGHDGFERLTRRQLQVLRLIALSETSKEIGQRLALSVKTVESHRTALMRHLDIHETAGLVRFAIRHGVISPDDPPPGEP